MSLGHWMREKLAARPPSDEKYQRAIQLADEVSGTIKSRASEPDPFTAITLDLLRAAMSNGGVDPALVADAFEMHQESKIYRGPS